MGWLSNISFSSSSSSSPSSSSSVFRSSSAESPKQKASDDGGWMFRSRRKLMRQRKQLLISGGGDQDGGGGAMNKCPSSPLPEIASSLATPQPLPLPELAKERCRKERGSGCNSGDIGDSRLPSPKAGDGAALNTPIQSVFASRDTRKNNDHAFETRSRSRRKNRDRNGLEIYQRLDVPIWSAPASPFSSPTLSPHRRSVGDLLPHINPMGNQVWSTPEIPTSDMNPGLPPPASSDYSIVSNDNSPVHSPSNRSPCRNPRSPPGSTSPLHTKLLVEASTARREGNGYGEVHPLPLPPGASLSLPSPQALLTPKPESQPVKGQWIKGKLIGRGTFGSVYVATNRETGALCAMKEVELFPDDPKSAECIKQLQQEIKVLSQLKHPNIVQYYGSEIVDDRFYIYLEYVHPGSINKYVHEHCGAITEAVVRSFTRHILSGLAYLHSTKTIHRDIKGANLLVDSCGVVKLADFGMAKHLSGHVGNLSLKGSPYWMAPELMQTVMHKDNNSDLALAVDIWSLGCTIIEMFTGKPPWSEYEGAAAMFKVMKDLPPIPETLSSEGKDFLRRCFRRNPAERPTAAMLLEHRFLKNSQPQDVQSVTPSVTQASKGMNYMDKPRPVELERKYDQSLMIPGILGPQTSAFPIR
ncbi:mitogen-activated protein kinase kinase kinase YODA [Prunus yedoensis var. nudiflora]|uniref:mitogen-activated protein kinase kinase kinase n=1 Tax=Prunus yedoensis var. nudiflora TaxID=2094558 RepID=A0A314ZL84_PRUYE|nr:mitogen-activated protein kinase kinase kinase YODA [Prunus yedoensis var. nudiflora]